MQPYLIEKNENFSGRTFEVNQLSNIDGMKESGIIILYGRRRVGKTELLEQAFRDRNVLKFEGLEGQDESVQKAQVLAQLALYADDAILAKVKVERWVDIFLAIAKRVKQGRWTVYFEEVQWLADYKGNFISELKYVWDNFFRHNPELLIILCGSATSFMIENVVHSKALYNRSQHEFHLREFNLIEAKDFLNHRTQLEVLDAYLTVGGIPEYLKRLSQDASILLSLCKNTFVANGFFSNEYQKVFNSSFAASKHYVKIVQFLSKQRFASRIEIAKHLEISPGGALTDILKDLTLCEIIGKYTPYNLNEDSRLARYCIVDPCLHFYFKFIQPIESKIATGLYNHRPMAALDQTYYQRWLGLSFERFCRKYHWVFANLLGFSNVSYQSGAFYNRQSLKDEPGYQIDLVYKRKDKVFTVCEIKYLQSKVKTKVIEEMERKLERMPKPEHASIQKILIAPLGAEQSLIDRHYFDRIITLEQLFREEAWYGFI